VQRRRCSRMGKTALRVAAFRAPVSARSMSPPRALPVRPLLRSTRRPIQRSWSMASNHHPQKAHNQEFTPQAHRSVLDGRMDGRMERMGLKSDCILVLIFSSPRNSSFTLASLQSGFGFWLLGSPRTLSRRRTGWISRAYTNESSLRLDQARLRNFGLHGISSRGMRWIRDLHFCSLQPPTIVVAIPPVSSTRDPRHRGEPSHVNTSFFSGVGRLVLFYVFLRACLFS
jgi:hypothetical protein